MTGGARALVSPHRGRVKIATGKSGGGVRNPKMFWATTAFVVSAFFTPGPALAQTLSAADVGSTGQKYEKLDEVTLGQLEVLEQRRDYDKEVQLLKPLADQGNAQAQYNLAVMYREGQGVTQDYAEGLRYLRMSADQGYPNAEYNMAAAYEHAQGVAKDHAMAIAWCLKAAEHGMAQAQFQISTSYLHGDGVPQDWGRGLEWTLKAADQGVVEAQFNAAILYAEGPPGVRRDRVQAYMWADLASHRFSAEPQARKDTILRDRSLMASVLTSAQKAEAMKLEQAWVTKHANDPPLLEIAP